MSRGVGKGKDKLSRSLRIAVPLPLSPHLSFRYDGNVGWVSPKKRPKTSGVRDEDEY